MKIGSYGDYDEQERKKAQEAPPPAPKPTPGYGPGGRGGGGGGYSDVEAAQKTQELASHTMPKESGSRRERGRTDFDRQHAIAEKEAQSYDNSLNEKIDAFEQKEAQREADYQAKRPSLSPLHERFNERIRAHKADREHAENMQIARELTAERSTEKSNPLADRIREHKAAQGNDELRDGASRSRSNVAARAEERKSPLQRMEDGKTVRAKDGTSFSLDKEKGEVVRQDKDGFELGRWSKEDFGKMTEQKGQHR